MIEKPRPETLTVSLYPDQIQRIRGDALARRVTVSAQVRDALAAYYQAVDQGRISPLASFWAGSQE